MIRVTAVLFFGSLPLLAQSPNQTGVQPPEQTAVQALTGAAGQLASRISPLLPRLSTVSLETQNLTSLPLPEWSNFRSLLQNELRKAGIETARVETTATTPESRVRVTLSEHASGLLFVVEVFTKDNRQVAMLPWNPASSARAKPHVTITKRTLRTQREPVLDVLLVDSDSEMLVLSTNAAASYRSVGDQWTPLATASMVLPRPLPRDPRGRLGATVGGFEAFLPVGTCIGAWNPELKLTCAGGIANWPGTVGTRWVADRNVVEGDAPTPRFEGWGSDWVSIADPCGAANVVIASSPNTEHDSVRAYLVRDSQANPVSDPLPLPGPVTALWPAGVGAESGKAATLVVHNLQTGEYEASRLVLACTE